MVLKLGQWIVDQKHLERSEICWRSLENVSWIDLVRNGEVLHRVKEEKNIIRTIKRRNASKNQFDKMKYLSSETRNVWQKLLLVYRNAELHVTLIRSNVRCHLNCE